MEPQLLRGQVIHVNEDGWVVINRGAQHGVSDGQRFAVLGERNPRQIRDPFPAPEGTDAPDRPVVLRADTAYEVLRVILVERQCCVAISDRVPPERTPRPFLGPQGELLLYTPPPADWRYDALELEEGEDAPADKADAASDDDQTKDDTASEGEPESETGAEDAPADEESAADLAERQQERLWDGALPLNAVQVGDEVVMALPYRPGAWEGSEAAASSPAPADAAAPSSSYDWLKL